MAPVEAAAACARPAQAGGPSWAAWAGRLLRQQRLAPWLAQQSPPLGRLGQRPQHKLRGGVRGRQLLAQLLHQELEAEPAHLGQAHTCITLGV